MNNKLSAGIFSSANPPAKRRLRHAVNAAMEQLEHRQMLSGDAYDPNDTLGAASNLGVVAGQRVISGLNTNDGTADWFKFTTTAAAGGNNYVSINGSGGDTDLYLYAANGGAIDFSANAGSNETVSLSNLPQGTYYVQVLTVGPPATYALTINAPGAGNQPQPPQPPPPVTPPPATTQSPYKGTPFNVGDTIQAEDYNNGGEGLAYHDTESANLGGKYRSDGVDIESTADAGGGYDMGFVHAGEYTNYTVNVPTTGTYTVAFRVASGGAGGAFRLYQDGKDISGSIAIPNTGNYQVFTTITRQVNLTAGTHIVGLGMDSNGANGFVGNFNWFKITQAGSPAPQPTGQTPFKGAASNVGDIIQAEDYNNGGEGVAYHDTDKVNQGGKYRSDGVDIESTTDSGGGYDVGFNYAGEWRNYTVNIPTTGTYNIDFRVASGGAGGTFQLYSDNKALPGTIAIPNTGGYQTWTTITRQVSLTAGTHVLGIAMVSNGANGCVGNLNWFRIYQPASTAASPGLNVQFYNNTTLSGTPTTSRVDGYINYAWTGSPATGIGVNNWSARWTGKIVPLYSQTYTFYSTSDDGVRVWINGQLLIDNWTAHGPTVNTGQIALTAGQKYDIKVEYFQGGGGAQLKLEWSSASQARGAVYHTQFYLA